MAYINRDEYCRVYCYCNTRKCDKSKCPIYTMPAANVTPVASGLWLGIKKYNDGERVIATCSHCKKRGELRTVRTEFGVWEINSPYCPSCGVRMEETT